MKAPSFTEAIDAVKEGKPTPLHVFIYHNEPIAYISPHWRQQFDDMLHYLLNEATEETNTSPLLNQIKSKQT